MTPGTTPTTAAPPDDPVRAALGDPRTLDELRLGARVLLCRARPGAPGTLLAQLVEEIVSRAAETALSARFDATRGTSVSAWLFGIIRNIVKKETCDRPPRVTFPAAVDWAKVLPDAAPPPDEQVEAQVEAQRVRAALAQLGSRDKELLEMHYFDGLNAPEIGARLNVSAATVRVWLHRARRAAEQILAPSRGEDES
jgi:RNA polymerase sigma-70 factor (ECF subfamily)